MTTEMLAQKQRTRLVAHLAYLAICVGLKGRATAHVVEDIQETSRLLRELDAVPERRS